MNCPPSRHELFAILMSFLSGCAAVSPVMVVLMSSLGRSLSRVMGRQFL